MLLVPPLQSSIPSGKDIPIEERAIEEVMGFGDLQWAPKGVQVRNPAFDVTPADLVTALITEKGVVQSPNANSLKVLMGS